MDVGAGADRKVGLGVAGLVKIIASLVVGLIALRGCVSCADAIIRSSSTAPAVASPGDGLRKISGVKAVEVNDVNVFLTTAYDAALPSMYLLGAGRTLRDAAEAVQADRAGLTTQTNLVILVQAKLTDRLGNESDEKILNLNYDLADLRAARLANLSDARLLDLAHEASVSNAAGGEVASDWCKDFGESAPNLCAKLGG